MKENKIQLIISNVKNSKASVGAVEFQVSMKNSVDNINTWPNREDTKGYLEKTELENKIEEYRQLVIKKAECDNVEVRLK